MIRLVFSLAAFAAALAPTASIASWQNHGTALSYALDEQRNPSSISDGSGGVIVVWDDLRTGVTDIYAQRLDASGNALWAVDGVPICTAVNAQFSPRVVSDGAGGAIIAWTDNRGGGGVYDPYAQRIDASGVVQWTANGVPITTSLGLEDDLMLTSDGAGGAIAAWDDDRNGNIDIYVARVDAAGNTPWTPGGVGACTVAGTQTSPQIVTDGAGGAIVVWRDIRFGNEDVFSQRIDSSGTVVWAAGGVALCTAANSQVSARIAADGNFGAIVTWHDYRGADADIYAQRLDSGGLVQWAVNGLAVCTFPDNQTVPQIVSDGAGGAIIAWDDFRNGADYSLYAQRISPSGSLMWVPNGSVVASEVQDQYGARMLPDGEGGVVIAWEDWRYVSQDIFAQRLNQFGNPLWQINGVEVCLASNNQSLYDISPDAGSGAIAVWHDLRSGERDVYAQRIEERFGTWGRPEPILDSVADIPGDQGGRVKVNWRASQWDSPVLQTVTHYSVWRATDIAAVPSQAVLVSSPHEITPDFGGTAVWAASVGTDYYWEWVGNQNILYQPAYTFSAPTRSDSTSMGSAVENFLVASHTTDQFVFWNSNVMSGYSVDNLAPSAPFVLNAQRVGPDVHLSWNQVPEGDLDKYAIYRADASGVTPEPMNFLALQPDTAMVDAGAPGSVLYYIVTALDVHENESAPSNEVQVSAVTGVGELPPVSALTVLQNRPNPFASSTMLDIGLPAAGPIQIGVYDIAGRRVRSLRIVGSEGWQQIPVEAVNDQGRPLVNGVYFYRVAAAGSVSTRKMLIQK